LQELPKACSRKYFIIPPPEIHMLRFILEAYEGIGLVTTLDAALGLVEISIAPGCEEEVAQILKDEENNLHLRPVWCGDEGLGSPEGAFFVDGKEGDILCPR
jgi:hypothetical protein